MAGLSDELRVLANHVEGVEEMYPEQAPGVPAGEMGAIYKLVREIEIRCHRLKNGKPQYEEAKYVPPPVRPPLPRQSLVKSGYCARSTGRLRVTR